MMPRKVPQRVRSTRSRSGGRCQAARRLTTLHGQPSGGLIPQLVAALLCLAGGAGPLRAQSAPSDPVALERLSGQTLSLDGPEWLLAIDPENIGRAEVACCTEPVRRLEDLVYGRKFGMALTMDVFEPAEPNGCGLLFLVNGGWSSSKSTPLMVTIRPEDYRVFLGRGYTMFAVVTSSQTKFTISEQIEDVLRAARFVRRHGAQFGVRPDRLGVLGASSGGHLALSLATRGGPGKSDSADPVERESSAVQAAACFFPPTDFQNYGVPGVDGAGVGPLAPLQIAFGPLALTAEGRRELGQAISPINYVTHELPPTLIIHGTCDDVVPLQQSQSFVAKARQARAPHAELIVRAGKGHGWGDFWKSTEDITAFADWFDRYLQSTGMNPGDKP